MAKYLTDVNLPRYFSLWNSPDYEFVLDMDDTMTDRKVWQYAKKNDLTIVRKDADYSDLALLNSSPPRVIHIRFGNMKIREFHQVMAKVWDETRRLSDEFKPVRVYLDRIEAID